MSGSRGLAAALTLTVVALAACDKKPANKPPRSVHPLEPDAAMAHVPKSDPGARRVVDFHTHLGGLAYPLFVQVGDRLGIERAVNMSGGSTSEHRARNLAAADAFADRIALFHNPDWSRMEGTRGGALEADALRESVRSGFAGLKISKALGLGVTDADGNLLPVDDARLDPLWSAAGELGIPVAIHTSDPKAFFEKPGPQNERHAELSLAPSWSFYGDEYPSREELLAQRDRMVAKHPKTTFVLLHFANNPEDIEYVDALLQKFPNVYVDLAARVAEVGRHDPAKVRDLFVRHQDRILFATDIQLSVMPTKSGQMAYRLTLGSISEEPPTLDDIAPFYEAHFRFLETSGAPIDHPVPIQGDWKVNPIDLPADVLEKVYWKNAERIVFAPWLGRRAAHGAVTRAAAIAAAPPATTE